MTQPPKRLTSLQASIEALGSNEHGVLLDMVAKSAGVNVARNGNGYFFDLASMPEDALAQVEQFVTFSVDNNRELERHDRIMHDQLKMLERVPAQSSGARPGLALQGRPGGPGGQGARSKLAVPDAPAPGRSRLAFIRRAGDAPTRRRTAADRIETRDTPVYMRRADLLPPLLATQRPE